MASDNSPAGRMLGAPGRGLDSLGDQLSFYGRAYGWGFRTIRRYKREVLRQLAEVTFGAGALALVGGTAAVVGFMNATTGAELAVQTFTATRKIGIEVLVGFLAAFVNLRIAVPLIATVALVATVGAGITAELGAKRISEEIDALEVMAIPPIPFLVTTRIIAGLLTITPLYFIALFISFGSSRLVCTLLYGVPGGAFDHYFSTFLIPADVLISYVEVLLMSVVIVSVHCYYGFNAKGGPAGVGQAVGRSVRLSLVLVLFTLFATTLLFFGGSDTFHLSR